MARPINRRSVLHAGGTALAALLAAGRRGAAASAPRAVIHSMGIISQRPAFYHGWPTVTRRRNGALLLVCSGGREAHVCPFGWVEMMRSADDGRTWSWPRVLMDSPIDDRDAGICETARGSLLVTTFTSLAYEPILDQAEQIPPGREGAWPPEKLARWQAAQRRLSPDERREMLGAWILRSTDSGLSWSAPYRSPVNSPHGPVPLGNGRLLYAGKELWTEAQRVGVCVSDDDGENWRWLADIPARTGDDPNNYHELHAVETADGRLIVHLRNHNEANHRETLQSESSDGGKTWAVPRPIGVWGLPSHLLRLSDGRLLMSYGHRRAPLGNQARVSTDHGRNWSDPIVISNDGASGDLGYPSTVELGDGSLLTVWYERLKDSPKAVLRQAHWSLQR